MQPEHVKPSADPAAPSIAIIGGGLAGLAAAVRAVERGLRVELFEKHATLGGRAGSFEDRTTDTTVDICQHVSMGCCTSFADFCRRTGSDDLFERHRRLHFIDPAGKQHNFCGTQMLPAPLHLLPGMMRLTYLTPQERLGIARCMSRLARETFSMRNEPTIGDWLRRQGQSQQAIDRFWSVVLVSALGETVERASARAAAKVFRDGFLASTGAYELELPCRPLVEIFDNRVGEWLTAHGATIHRRAAVRRIAGSADRVTAIVLPDGVRREFDAVVLALPWNRAGATLPTAIRGAIPKLDESSQLEPCPITAVHLWFDRPITRLPHAALIGRLSQWLFRPQWDATNHQRARRFYHQVVISASGPLLGRARGDLVEEVCRDLQVAFPKTNEARLLHWRVATRRSAVFSMLPGVDSLRPAQQTPVDNLALAGDWTSTGWPATMEGAVRSGYLAMEGILTHFGRGERLLAPDPTPGVLARLLVPQTRNNRQ